MNAEYLTEATIVIPKTSTEKIAQVMGHCMTNDGAVIEVIKLISDDDAYRVIETICGGVYASVRKNDEFFLNSAGQTEEIFHKKEVPDSYCVWVRPDKLDRINGSIIKDELEKMQERSLPNRLRRFSESIRYCLTQGHVVFP